MQMFLLRSIMLASLILTLVSSNVIEDLNCKAQTAAAEAQLQNEVFVEGLIRCLKRSFLLSFPAFFFSFSPAGQDYLIKVIFSNNPRQECDKEGLKARSKLISP